MVLKEAMTNIMKHSNCKNVSLSIAVNSNTLSICVSDDGKGFKVEDKMNGYGLRNIETRSQQIHATVNIESTPDRGTSIKLSIKLNPNDKTLLGRR